jgi:hypothetical protein
MYAKASSLITCLLWTCSGPERWSCQGENCRGELPVAMGMAGKIIVGCGYSRLMGRLIGLVHDIMLDRE